MPTKKTAADSPVNEAEKAVAEKPVTAAAPASAPAPAPEAAANTAAATPAKGPNTLVIIVVVLLLICCVISSLVACYFIYAANKLVVVSPTPGGLNPTSSVKYTPIIESSQPDASTVISNFSAVTSYKLHADSSDAQGELTLDAKFVYPDKEYSIESNGDEEILIGSKVYVRNSGETAWVNADQSTLTGFHKLFLQEVFPAIEDNGALMGTKDGYWYYTEGDPATTQGQYQLYVNKESKMPAIFKLVVQNKVILTVEFNDYNDTGITIEAPV